MLLAKDFGKFKVLDTKKLEPSKRVTQNLVHKSLENITHFLKVRRLQPKYLQWVVLLREGGLVHTSGGHYSGYIVGEGILTKTQ